MIAQPRTFDNRWGYHSYHNCPKCHLSAASIAHSLTTSPKGSEDFDQAVRASGCPKCGPKLRRWWRVFSRQAIFAYRESCLGQLALAEVSRG